MSSQQINPKPKIFGRLFRLILGIYFAAEVWPVLTGVPLHGVFIRLLWVGILVIIYVIIHLIIIKLAPQINSIAGAIIAFTPFLAVFLLGYGGPAATGALTFLSLSLIIAAIRGDSGCEVMTIPALILGKHTHLCCLLFSPVDWCEQKFY